MDPDFMSEEDYPDFMTEEDYVAFYGEHSPEYLEAQDAAYEASFYFNDPDYEELDE